MVEHYRKNLRIAERNLQMGFFRFTWPEGVLMNYAKSRDCTPERTRVVREDVAVPLMTK